MRKIPIILIMIACCVSCSKEPQGQEQDRPEHRIAATKHYHEEDPSAVLGTWQLVGVFTWTLSGDETEEYDYSQDNVVYEFKTGNVLTVSGDIDKIEAYTGHEAGIHTYYLIGVGLGPGYILSQSLYIDGKQYFPVFSDNDKSRIGFFSGVDQKYYSLINTGVAERE